MRVFGKSFVVSVSMMAAISFVFPSVAAASPVVSQQNIRYTVQGGDSFWEIAHKYQLPISNLMEMNPTQSVYNMQIGSVLVIPASTSGVESHTTAVDSHLSSPRVNPENLYWMARVINAEASGEPFEAQVAVGDAVLHRLASTPGFKTVHDVVFAVENGHYQFTCVANGYIYTDPTGAAIEAAHQVLSGHTDVVPGATVFFNPSQTPASSWVRHQAPVKTIGDLIFAK